MKILVSAPATASLTGANLVAAGAGVDEEQKLCHSLLPLVTASSGGSLSPDGGIAWQRGEGDPDYYWADPVTGDIKCTKHCLWEEVK